MSPDQAAESPVLCDYADCQAPNGGACALGHASADDCPEASAARQRAAASEPEVQQPDSESEELPTPPPPAGIELRSGRAMTIEQGNILASRKGARIILPAGPSGAGKTTYLIELYARFLKGKQFDATFLESETLLEFDYLLFPSRLSDDNQVSETWRTRLEDATQALLHLGVDSAQFGVVHLLLTNITGELFERICDHGQALKEMPLLGVGDRLLIFIDGEKAASGGPRASALSRTRQFIKVLVEEEVLPPFAEVGLVTAKLDKLQAKGTDVLTTWSDHETRLLEEMEALERPIRSFRIAARPMATAPQEDDLEELFNWLLATSPQPAAVVAPPSAPGRAFEGFAS
jgi:hypothetical protein